MAIVQCANNHYYDDKRDIECPYCKNHIIEDFSENDFNEQLTSFADEETDDYKLTEGYDEEVNDFQKTIGIFTDETSNSLTAGWFVALDGSQKGKTYVINSGRNFVGKTEFMDIVFDDETIKSENHFSIIYDPKGMAFYIVNGEGITYINDKPVVSQQQIFDGDIIKAGECKYIFVPYCKEGRHWK